MSAWLLGNGALAGADWLALFAHFLALSLLAVGGAITTVPEMHRVVVDERRWLSDADFTASVALAQAAPGPNVLFVAVIGFNVGGLAGVLVTMLGTLLPSTTLAMAASRWGARNARARGLRTFTAGMAPLTIGLLLATGWILLEPLRAAPAVWPGALLVAVSAAALLASRISPLWLIGAGALAGAAGLV